MEFTNKEVERIRHALDVAILSWKETKLEDIGVLLSEWERYVKETKAIINKIDEGS